MQSLLRTTPFRPATAIRSTAAIRPGSNTFGIQQRMLSVSNDNKVEGIFARLQKNRYTLASIYQPRFAPNDFNDFKASSKSLEGYFNYLKLIGNSSCPDFTVFNKTAESVTNDLEVLLESGCVPTPKLLFDILLFPYDLGDPSKERHLVQIARNYKPEDVTDFHSSILEISFKETILIKLARHLKSEDVNKKDESFLSLLHYAVLFGYVSFANELIIKGADVTEKGHLGLNSYELALYTRNRILIWNLNDQLNHLDFDDLIVQKSIEEELSHLDIKFLTRTYEVLAYTARNKSEPNFHLVIPQTLPDQRYLGNSPLEIQLNELFGPIASADGKMWSPMAVAFKNKQLADIIDYLQKGWHFSLEGAYRRQTLLRKNEPNPLSVVSLTTLIDGYKGDPVFFNAVAELLSYYANSVSYYGISDEVKAKIAHKQNPAYYNAAYELLLSYNIIPDKLEAEIRRKQTDLKRTQPSTVAE